MQYMPYNNLKIVLSAEQIEKRTEELACDISAEYRGKSLTVICVLRGSFIFAADLLRRLTVDLYLDFMTVTRYGLKDKPGELKILSDLKSSIEGKDVLIVEDIIDEGVTLLQLKNLLLERGPASLKVCTIFDKPERRCVSVSGDFVGFSLPDIFVVGYGLDYKQKYRNLPFLAAEAE